MVGGEVKGFEGMDPKTLEALARRGQLVVINTEGGRFKSVSVGVAVDAPAEKVWEALTGYESYPRFMPQTESTEVKRNPDGTVDVDFVIVLKLSIAKLRIKYTIRHVLHEPERIDFSLIKGDLKTVEGAWDLIGLGPESTLAFYTVFSDIKSLGRIAKFVMGQDPSFEMAINTSTATLVAAAVKRHVEGAQRGSAATQ